MNSEVVKMLKNSPVNPTFTNLHPIKCYGYIKTCSRIEHQFGDVLQWPKALQDLKQTRDELAFQSMGMAISFMEDTLIAERTLKPSTYVIYTPESQDEALQNMVLDS